MTHIRPRVSKGSLWGLFLMILPQLISALALAGSVKISVGLNPAGSFQATSEAVTGVAWIHNNALMAQRVSLKLDTLQTGIELRDRHMKENYFETAKYPLAVLESGNAKDGYFTGTLSLHGVTQPVSGSYEQSGSTVTGKFKTSLSAFQIKKARYMGVGAEDEVEVEVTLPVRKN